MVRTLRQLTLVTLTGVIIWFILLFSLVSYTKGTVSPSILLEDTFGQVLLEEIIKPDEQIVIYYNHSIMKVPVLEFYQVRDTILYLVCLISREPLLSFPGYEHYSFEPWNGFLEEPLPLDLDLTQNDWFIIQDLEIKCLENVHLLVGQHFVDHILFVGARKICLANLVDRGQVIIIKIR